MKDEAAVSLVLSTALLDVTIFSLLSLLTGEFIGLFSALLGYDGLVGTPSVE